MVAVSPPAPVILTLLAQLILQVIRRKQRIILIGGNAADRKEIIQAVEVHIHRDFHHLIVRMPVLDSDRLSAGLGDAAVTRIPASLMGDLILNVCAFYRVIGLVLRQVDRLPCVRLNRKVLRHLNLAVLRQDDARMLCRRGHSALRALLLHPEGDVVFVVRHHAVIRGHRHLAQETALSAQAVRSPGMPDDGCARIARLVFRLAEFLFQHRKARVAEHHDADHIPHHFGVALRTYGFPLFRFTEAKFRNIREFAGSACHHEHTVIIQIKRRRIVALGTTGVEHAGKVIPRHLIFHLVPGDSVRIIGTYISVTLIPVVDLRRFQRNHIALRIDVVQTELRAQVNVIRCDQVHCSAPLDHQTAAGDIHRQRIGADVCILRVGDPVFRDRQRQHSAHGPVIGDRRCRERHSAIEAVGDDVSLLQAGDGRGDAHMVFSCRVVETVDIRVCLQTDAHRLTGGKYAVVVDPLFRIDQDMVLQQDNGTITAGLPKRRRGCDLFPCALCIQLAVEEAVIRIIQRYFCPCHRREYPGDHRKGLLRTACLVESVRRGKRDDYRIFRYGDKPSSGCRRKLRKACQIVIKEFARVFAFGEVCDHPILFLHRRVKVCPDHDVLIVNGTKSCLAPFVFIRSQQQIRGQQAHHAVPAALYSQAVKLQRSVCRKERGTVCIVVLDDNAVRDPEAALSAQRERGSCVRYLFKCQRVSAKIQRQIPSGRKQDRQRAAHVHVRRQDDPSVPGLGPVSERRCQSLRALDIPAARIGQRSRRDRPACRIGEQHVRIAVYVSQEHISALSREGQAGHAAAPAADVSFGVEFKPSRSQAVGNDIIGAAQADRARRCGDFCHIDARIGCHHDICRIRLRVLRVDTAARSQCYLSFTGMQAAH